jgi:hypothetical protein
MACCSVARSRGGDPSLTRTRTSHQESDAGNPESFSYVKVRDWRHQIGRNWGPRNSTGTRKAGMRSVQPFPSLRFRASRMIGDLEPLLETSASKRGTGVSWGRDAEHPLPPADEVRALTRWPEIRNVKSEIVMEANKTYVLSGRCAN